MPRRGRKSLVNCLLTNLTIVIRPTREFPVDPANEAGFDNSGESLSMSPALVKRSLAAARLVADHVVLTPEGFVFAPHPAVTDTDRDKCGKCQVARSVNERLSRLSTLWDSLANALGLPR